MSIGDVSPASSDGTVADSMSPVPQDVRARAKLVTAILEVFATHFLPSLAPLPPVFAGVFRRFPSVELAFRIYLNPFFKADTKDKGIFHI